MSLQIINTSVTPQTLQNTATTANVASIYNVQGTFTTTGTTVGYTTPVLNPATGSQLSLPATSIPLGCVVSNPGSAAATGVAGTLSMYVWPDNTSQGSPIFPGVAYTSLTAGASISSNCPPSTLACGITGSVAKNVWVGTSATGAVAGSFNTTIYYTM